MYSYYISLGISASKTSAIASMLDESCKAQNSELEGTLSSAVFIYWLHCTNYYFGQLNFLQANQITLCRTRMEPQADLVAPSS